jgi:hypothetical protein
MCIPLELFDLIDVIVGTAVVLQHAWHDFGVDKAKCRGSAFLVEITLEHKSLGTLATYH